jgi:hypothetical protein
MSISHIQKSHMKTWFFDMFLWYNSYMRVEIAERVSVMTKVQKFYDLYAYALNSQAHTGNNTIEVVKGVPSRNRFKVSAELMKKYEGKVSGVQMIEKKGN